jgi:hypothetical protein
LLREKLHFNVILPKPGIPLRFVTADGEDEKDAIVEALRSNRMQKCDAPLAAVLFFFY